MDNRKYWQNFGEKNDSEAYKATVKDEFKNSNEPAIPFDESKGLLDAVTPRRDFLKYLGFSTAAAAIAASCQTPVEKSIPFANKPEDVVPGQANYYATTYIQDGDVNSVVAKVRDGRPIKLEGNELSPLTSGGTSARVQASVLDLYDTARLRFPTIGQKETTFATIDKEIANGLATLGGKPVVLLTSSIVSPTSKAVISQFLAKYPGSRQVTYDAVSYSGILLANEATYGKRAIPSYHFENADVIVSLGADFLSTWLSPTEFSKQYATGKKLDEKNPKMSKHFQFESLLSMTGANADERFIIKPSQEGIVAAALLNAVNGQGVSGVSDAKVKAGIEKVAKALAANKGRALVVSGSNDTNIQIVVNAINEAIGANGTTIDWAAPVNYRQGIDSDFAALVQQMNQSTIGAVFIIGANPSYNYFNAEQFNSGLKRTPLTVSFAERLDETAELCKYQIPTNHFLESWDDAEPKAGYISFAQPTINPLFKTRQWQESLMTYAGIAGTYAEYLKQTWITKLGSIGAWEKAIQDGVINPATAAIAGSPFNSSAVGAAVAAASAAVNAGKNEVVLYAKAAIGEGGQGANNPWLQELPDPVTRATWDNYAVVSPGLAKALFGIDLNDNGSADHYEVNPAKPVIKVTVNNKSLSLPIIIIPGTEENTIGIALGYGRSEKTGKTAAGVGKNAYIFVSQTSNGNLTYKANATVEKTSDIYSVALIQTHNIYDTKQGKRVEIMKELTLADFRKDPKEILKEREHELEEFGGVENFEKQGTIYPYYEKPGIHWSMSVDLNSCTGCGACVVACQAENNVPVVGKSEVLRFHDMEWLRIDRYYSGDMENPQVVFQPLMCQHCDNAPCENVCPVNATNHSTEGLNQMAYNRCIGTRYCANNCPYKVRRFNWADYTGADSFKNNQDQKLVGVLDPAVHQMNDDLTRMVLNPDVTVRSRGVMEKCSFCVQRLQEGKLIAKRAGRPLKSGENNEWDVRTACQQSCPSDCIVFGNVNDPNSAISKVRRENPLRLFYSLEQLHIMPNVNYLAKVRNRDEVTAHEEA
ncbi:MULTISPECIES: TAT-variant-translocated molybdopterin oxidoreductase [Chitinophagaceae]